MFLVCVFVFCFCFFRGAGEWRKFAQCVKVPRPLVTFELRLVVTGAAVLSSLVTFELPSVCCARLVDGSTEWEVVSSG